MIYFYFIVVIMIAVTEPDRCNPNPCKNGGKCKFLPEKNDYICDCLGNFGGKDCSGPFIINIAIVMLVSHTIKCTVQETNIIK